MASIDASSLKYSAQKATLLKFAYAGAIGATANDAMNRVYSDVSYHLYGAFAYHGTA